jgi:anaerobic magnesium-protoporphyrin IX monomethyl ester cyclase
MRVALIYPPSCDPTAPYLALPTLAASLRARGIEVFLIDANIEAYDHLLRRDALLTARDRVEHQIGLLERRASLVHEARLRHHTLWNSLGDAWTVPDTIEAAVATLRDRTRFYDPETYGAAVTTVEAALRVVGAAYGPLQIDFTSYRTPLALTSPEEIRRDAEPAHNPFHDYVAGKLLPQLRRLAPDLVGLSLCFPGQLQPAYGFGLAIHREMPQVHLTAGGPALTQILARLSGDRLLAALGPFDSAVLFEGEASLLALCRALAGGGSAATLATVPGLVRRKGRGSVCRTAAAPPQDLASLPAPDFEGLPLHLYWAPELVLPYDPSRGCYWGRCAFCHYGLSESGTARYRERPLEQVIAHLRELNERWHNRLFYFSHDAIAPKTLVALAAEMIDAGLNVRWATDLKPERYYTKERARTLRTSGALACSLGVESAAPRVLELIDKGAPVDVAADTVRNLDQAGIAVEIMSFTGFPTETAEEATATLRFIGDLSEHVAAFIVGQFALTHGSRVARDPHRFGLLDVWQVAGDMLGTALFFREGGRPRTSRQADVLERQLDRLSSRWQLRRYPWAGSLSTAHTLLYYEHFGRAILHELAQRPSAPMPEATLAPRVRSSRFDLAHSAQAWTAETEIWHQMVYQERSISRGGYRRLARIAPSQLPEPGRYRIVAGEAPVRTRRRS